MTRNIRWTLAAIVVAGLALGLLWRDGASPPAELGVVVEAGRVAPPVAERSQRLRWSRPVSRDAPAEAEVRAELPATLPVAEPPEPAPVPRAIALDDLDDGFVEILHADVMAQLSEVKTVCEIYVAEALNTAAYVTLDDRGLVELELASYDEGPELPEDFGDCVEDVLWEQSWVEVPAHTELQLKLTFPIGPSDEGGEVPH